MENRPTGQAVDVWRDLPSIHRMLQERGVRPKKNLGQNFLVHSHMTEKLVRFLPSLSKGSLLEIGPGPGGLTRSLLQHHQISITALERDQEMIEILQPLKNLVADKLLLIEGDACQLDLASLLQEKPRYLQANLPFHIATPLMLSLLKQAHKWQEWVLMVQKEVGERLLAKNGRKSYGFLSVMAQGICDLECLMVVNATAFCPEPKVDAMVVRMTPKREWSEERLRPVLAMLESILRHAFRTRRKKIGRMLAERFSIPNRGLEKLGITDDMRADHVTVDAYWELARLLSLHADKK